MVCKDFEVIVKKAKELTPKGTAVVAGADDTHVVEAVIEARREGISDAILIGNLDRTRMLISSLALDPDEFRILDAANELDACVKAVEVVKSEPRAYLMKGMVESASLLRQVASKQNGLNTGRIISHVAVIFLPNYPKLIVDTDGGMIPHPTLAEKKSIVLNAVETLHSLGYEMPKIAALCAAEKVNPKIPETVDAAALKEMNLAGEIPDCVIEGPISYDLAMSADAARLKRFDSPHCGDFDILLMPNMVAGNILAKSWIMTCGAVMAGIVVGAKVPVVLTSRMSSSQEKFLSMALAAAVSKGGPTTV